jgi:protein TonB
LRPIYPELAKKARIQGVVKMAALIDEHGMVEELKLVSGHSLLVQAAFDAAKRWRYRPARKNGRPAAAFTTIEIAFTLEARPVSGESSGSVRV